tara:strand:+ start:136 stop:732 length:597 start_codon:yes stop_codon:yes gene_type:complete
MSKSETNIYIPRLLEKYRSDICKHLSSTLKINNVMRLPQIKKVVINMGIGDARENSNALKSGLDELTAIAGQKAVVTKAKKAISNFKIRAGDPVGARVTLRGTLMYEFLDRFISVASPRIRDFQGLSNKGFDGRGNYNFGIDEQIIFPEINYDQVNKIRGLNISVVTSAQSNEEAYELLIMLGLPIRKKKNKKEIIEA